MNEFIEKLIKRVKLLDLDGIKMIEDGKYELIRKVDVIEVINQVAEEYKLFGNSEQVKGGWIPCSERLPNKAGEYIVTIKEAKKATILNYNGSWYDEFDNMYAVIAWQPFPANYTEGE